VRFHPALPSFIDVRALSDQARVKSLLSQLDTGEAEAIVLAAESNADYLLIDERRGRQAATEAGIPIIGLIGIILLAKNRGFVPAVKDLLSELQSKAGFYIHPNLLQKALEAAGE
jgi:predicted nucleic acid-binding protein